MLVSVIIPCYNGENYIKKCVEKTLKQTYKNIEIIIVDDKSTDNSKNIILELEKKYPKKVKALISKTNNGPGGAKNEGLKIAKGEYLCFVDCDDYLDETFVEKMLNEIKKDENLDLVLSSFKKVNEKEEILYERKFDNSEEAFWQLVPSWGKLYRKKWLNDNNMALPYGRVFEDILFQTQQFLCKPKYKLADITGYNYMYNNTSISHTTLCSFKKDSLKKEQKYLKELKTYAKTKEDELILEYFSFRAMCWHLLKSGCNVGTSAMKKEYTEAFNFLKKEFPNFHKNKYISLGKRTKERFVIKMALYFIKILYKLRLSKLFFIFYGKVNLSKLWPNL